MCKKLKIDVSRFSHIYLDAMNREQEEYNLPRFEFEVLVTGYDVERRAAVLKRWYELETGQATPLSQQSKESELPADPNKQINIAIQSIALAKAYGFEGNQAALSADRATKYITGFSPLEAMGQKQLPAPIQEMTFTPTQLGQMMTPPTNPREVNQLLEAAGMQGKLDTQWIPTDRGMVFCEILDTGKAHNSGIPVKQVKWFKKVLGCLLTPAIPEIPVNQNDSLIEADPDQECIEGDSNSKRIHTRQLGRYGLKDYHSFTELAEIVGLLRRQVIALLEGQGIIRYVRLGKTSKKYILTEKGWVYGAMYHPTEKIFIEKSSHRLIRSNCQPVFNDSVIDLF